MDENVLQGCLVRIRGILPSLKSAESRVATYILKNPKQIIHLSITELAEFAQSAEATIFRLCKRLGYGGYQAFKISLASDLVKPLQNIHQEITPDDSLLTIAAKVFHSNMEALQDTLTLVDEKSLEKALFKPCTKRQGLSFMAWEDRRRLRWMHTISLYASEFPVLLSLIHICRLFPLGFYSLERLFLRLVTRGVT